jgi:glycosyltransferase involved in cell wall biosynthesis
MKIGIEAQRIFRAGKHGMDVVALELIRRIQKADHANTYYLFARNGPDRNCIQDSENLQLKILPAISYADWEQLALPAAVKKYSPDILHCTANTAPLKCSVPLVLTLHDIIYLERTDLGGSAYQNTGNLYRRFIVPHAVRNARSIITVSEYERSVIVAKFPEAAEKISVIYNGVDERFHQHEAKDSKELFRSAYGLPKDYILFLGNTAPKKNTPNVIKAYVHYCELEKNPLPIVVTDYSQDNIKHILRQLQKPQLINSFILPGHIPIQKMPLLYNCSALFLYPSLRESFGLPLLEAMACGVPVITSNVSAMPEVAGGAAVFVDPDNYKDIAGSILSLLADEGIRTSYIQKGLARASQFSWDNAAKHLMQVYIR